MHTAKMSRVSVAMEDGYQGRDGSASGPGVLAKV